MPARSASRQAPVGGWDTREALADMPGDRAPILDNWFPSTDKVTVRRGHEDYATGMPAAVESLLRYVPKTGADKLFAASDGKIYDVSNSGAVGAAVVSSMTNNRWQQVQMGTTSNHYLFMFNGADAPRLYDGSSWGTATITGPTAANLIWGNLHQRRLWFGEEDSLSAWYFPVNTISGTAVEFSLAGVATLGGYIMAMGTWTRDAGDGADDVAVFLTSEGEAIVYSGIDPSAAASWSLVGVFRIGKPIGRRCMIKTGADLVMVTEDGFVSANTILSLDRSQAELGALSAQINKAVNDAVRSKGTLFGWEPFLYPRGTMLMFNVPQSGTTAHQYVFNTITGAPCRFTGVNGLCWQLKGDEAYFGTSDGKVCKADTGATDNGTAIEADGLQAFSYFGAPGTNKAFKQVEPIFEADGPPAPALDMNVDFTITTPLGTPTTSPSTNLARWDEALWDDGVWAGSDLVYRSWRGVRGIGRSGALRVRISSSTSSVSWIATTYTYIPAGLI